MTSHQEKDTIFQYHCYISGVYFHTNVMHWLGWLVESPQVIKFFFQISTTQNFHISNINHHKSTLKITSDQVFPPNFQRNFPSRGQSPIRWWSKCWIEMLETWPMRGWDRQAPAWRRPKQNWGRWPFFLMGTSSFFNGKIISLNLKINNFLGKSSFFKGTSSFFIGHHWHNYGTIHRFGWENWERWRAKSS